MTLQNTSTWRIRPFATDRFDSRYVTWMCALFTVLILGRAVNNAMLYAFFGIALAVFAVSNPAHCVAFLFFLLPVASIMKFYVGSMSYYTVFFFLTVVKMVIAHRKIDLRLFALAVLFVVYNFVFSGTRGITTLITMVAGSLILYYVRQENISAKTITFAFAAGICLASCIALLQQSLPIVNRFIQGEMLKMGDGEYAHRFSGLSGNPNYYTMDIIMVQAALLVLMFREQKQTLCLIGFGILSVFGFMSISQSYLLTWILLVFCWFLLSLKKGIGGVLKFVFIGVLMLAVVAVFAFDYLEAFAFRLRGSQGSISSVTTGRTDIWKDYFEVIFGNMKVLFFGSGFGQTIASKRGAHNTYIESIFVFGIVGSSVLLGMLKASMRKILTARIMWVPVLMLLVRMMAIGIISHDNLWFYLGLIVLLSQHCAARQKLELTK